MHTFLAGLKDKAVPLMDGDDPTSTYLEARVLPYEDSLA
jgi:hypothetical protein